MNDQNGRLRWLLVCLSFVIGVLGYMALRKEDLPPPVPLPKPPKATSTTPVRHVNKTQMGGKGLRSTRHNLAKSTDAPSSNTTQPEDSHQNHIRASPEKDVRTRHWRHDQCVKGIESGGARNMTEGGCDIVPTGDGLTSVAAIHKHFSDVLLIVMVSVKRFSLVPRIKLHYDPYFAHIIFVGPKNGSAGGIAIEGHRVEYGNAQYNVVVTMLRRYDNFTGYLYCNDDLMLHPWRLARHNKSLVWLSDIGVANIRSTRPVGAVSGMSMEKEFRNHWPNWKRSRLKIHYMLKQGGHRFRQNLRTAALRLGLRSYRESRYPAKFRTDDNLEWVCFFTITDLWYLPGRHREYALELFSYAQEVVIFQESAIPTIARGLGDPVYSRLFVQYSWRSTNASDCLHPKWKRSADGFHRCRHDHRFARRLYEGKREEIRSDCFMCLPRSYVISHCVICIACNCRWPLTRLVFFPLS